MSEAPSAVLPSSRSRWVLLFFAGWVISQVVVGSITYLLVAPAFLVEGVASGVAAAEVLENTSIVLTAGTSLWAMACLQIPVWSMQLGTVALATTGMRRSWRRDLGLGFRAADVAIGAIGGIGAQFGVGLVYQLFRVDSDGPAKQLTSRGSGTAGFIGLLLLLAVAAPVVEELLFRGLLQRGLSAVLPESVAWVSTAAFFALVHFQWVQLPGLFVAGLVFGGLAWRFDRLGPAIFAHIFFNATTVVGLALL